MMGGKREKERRSDKRPGAGKVVYMQTETCVTGDREGGGGTEEWEEEEEGGGKTDGGAVRGSTGAQHYNYPD